MCVYLYRISHTSIVLITPVRGLIVSTVASSDGFIFNLLVIESILMALLGLVVSCDPSSGFDFVLHMLVTERG